MSTQNVGPSSFAGLQVPPPEAFGAAAQAHADVRLSLNGEEWAVRGTGTMPGSGRQVAWVDGGPDVTSVFVESLSRGFSRGIGNAVAREFDLQPSPGKPLSSRSVQDALAMAQTAQAPLAGVDFMTRLDLSAVGNGGGFRQVAQQAGVDPAGLSPARRQRIDAEMAGRFEAAAREGPTALPVAAAWLTDLLKTSGL